MTLFKPYHIDAIRRGEKTVTRREWDKRQVIPGNVYMATTELFVPDEECDCYIRIEDVYRQKLGEMTDEDARKEGEYDNLDEFREGYEDVYGEGTWNGDKEVFVVEFEYVGEERPIEIRDVDELTNDEIAYWLEEEIDDLELTGEEPSHFTNEQLGVLVEYFADLKEKKEELEEKKESLSRA